LSYTNRKLLHGSLSSAWLGAWSQGAPPASGFAQSNAGATHSWTSEDFSKEKKALALKTQKHNI
jgi:hypothetical protein